VSGVTDVAAQSPAPLPTTLGELRASGAAYRPVKAEIRANLLARLGRGEPSLPGIVGFEETVLPQVENAILSGQDVILLGERAIAQRFTPGYLFATLGRCKLYDCREHRLLDFDGRATLECTLPDRMRRAAAAAALTEARAAG